MTAASAVAMKIQLDKIRTDGGTQARATLNLDTVADYADAGDVLPPVTVFYDGMTYWLADGFHRVAAAAKTGATEIAVNVKEGTQRDAILFACGANAEHGLPRTNADKRRAVMTLLNDPEWSRWSDSEIARRCKVSHEMVRKLRPSPATIASDAATAAAAPVTRLRRDKHGNVSTMNVTKIGKAKMVDETIAPNAFVCLQRMIADGKYANEIDPLIAERLTDGEISPAEAEELRELARKTATFDEADSEPVDTTNIRKVAAAAPPAMALAISKNEASDRELATAEAKQADAPSGMTVPAKDWKALTKLVRKLEGLCAESQAALAKKRALGHKRPRYGSVDWETLQALRKIPAPVLDQVAAIGTVVRGVETARPQVAPS